MSKTYQDAWLDLGPKLGMMGIKEAKRQNREHVLEKEFNPERGLKSIVMGSFGWSCSLKGTNFWQGVYIALEYKDTARISRMERDFIKIERDAMEGFKMIIGSAAETIL